MKPFEQGVQEKGPPDIRRFSRAAAELGHVSTRQG